jgi:TetR/AcrR family transcriptional regulator, transcriptional repressor for nem operon
MAPLPRRAPSTTSTQILDVAERLAQTRGFNGFSYADIAAELGITKASLHYHFATKADLGRALIERYTASFGAVLSAIETSGADAQDRLRRYVQVYGDVLGRDRLCLCGMLAAEVTTLPDEMQSAIRRFFDENELWLTRVLETGRRDRALTFAGDATEVAGALTAGLEGAMLLARSYGDSTRFSTAAARLLDDLTRATAARSADGSRDATGRSR